MLEKLDGLCLAGIFAGETLKKFRPRQQLHLNRAHDLGLIETPTFDKFLAGGNDSDLSDILEDLF